MLFSIIIPTFNAEKDIADSIKSVLKQNFFDFEVIVVDGLSKDQTAEIVSGFNDERIKLFSEKDNGVYDAMNKGIERAEGEWLYFLGSDDALYNDSVLMDVQHFISTNSNSDFLYGEAIFKHSRLKHYGVTNLSRILFLANICHQAIFYHHSVFKKVGNYNLEYQLYADWDLNIRCFTHPEIKVKFIDKIIATYNEVDGMSARLLDTDANFLNNLHQRQVCYLKQYASRPEFLKEDEYAFSLFLRKTIRIKKDYSVFSEIFFSRKFIKHIGVKRWLTILMAALKVLVHASRILKL